MLLVFYSVAFVVTEVGTAHFHRAVPFGTPGVVPDSAEAVCNQSGCEWSGKLRDAVDALTGERP